MNTLWMMVDLNDNELPLAVADSAAELARLAGVREATIRANISNSRRLGCRCRYVKVEAEDDNE